MEAKSMDKQEKLMRIERSLWTNDAALYEATYAAEAMLIFPDVGRIGLEEALEAIPETPARTLCATLYARRGDTWRVLFQRQTSIWGKAKPWRRGRTVRKKKGSRLSLPADRCAN